MDRWYDLNSWSRMYREEALREARMRHLGRRRQAKADGGSRNGDGVLGSASKVALSLLSNAAWRKISSAMKTELLGQEPGK